MELEKIRHIEEATWVNRKEIFRLGVAILFIVGIMLYVGISWRNQQHAYHRRYYRWLHGN